MKYLDTRAQISDCGRYRYTLYRQWVEDRKWHESEGWCLFIMLNPSTADGTKDDPTIRRCVSFAERWGHGGLVVCNLFALRATDPRELYKADDPVGPENDWRTLGQAASVRRIVCAWGVHGRLRGRDEHVLGLIRQAGLRPQHLGLTKDGHPRHPLYVAGATETADFPEAIRVGGAT